MRDAARTAAFGELPTQRMKLEDKVELSNALVHVLLTRAHGAWIAVCPRTGPSRSGLAKLIGYHPTPQFVGSARCMGYVRNQSGGYHYFLSAVDPQ